MVKVGDFRFQAFTATGVTCEYRVARLRQVHFVTGKGGNF